MSLFVLNWKLKLIVAQQSATKNYGAVRHTVIIITSYKNIHFEMILDVGIGEKRKETRFLI